MFLFFIYFLVQNEIYSKKSESDFKNQKSYKKNIDLEKSENKSENKKSDEKKSDEKQSDNKQADKQIKEENKEKETSTNFDKDNHADDKAKHADDKAKENISNTNVNHDIKTELEGNSTKLSISNSKHMSHIGFSDILIPVMPAVVSISCLIKEARNNTHDFMGSPLQDLLEQLLEQHGGGGGSGGNNSIKREGSLGSGFFVSKDGYIVTNYHVIKQAHLKNGTITVTSYDEKSYIAKVVGVDLHTDLALLKIAADREFHFLEWADSNQVKIGDLCFVLGSPFGLGFTATFGMISNRARDLNDNSFHDWIQTDAPLNPGNSGGPMINIDKKVIGVSTAIYTPNGGSVGIGFCIPSYVAAKIINALKTSGKYDRGFFGVVPSKEYNDDTAIALGLEKAEGVLIDQVTEGGPAETAGIKRGDVILTLNGTKIKDVKHFIELIGNSKAGSIVSVTVWRNKKNGSETVKLEVKIGEYEEKSENNPPLNSRDTHDIIGMKIKNLTTKEAKRIKKMNKKGITSGVKVVYVDPNKSISDELDVNDIIFQIGQEDVPNVASCIKIINDAIASKRKSILIYFIRNNNPYSAVIKLMEEKKE